MFASAMHRIAAEVLLQESFTSELSPCDTREVLVPTSSAVGRNKQVQPHLGRHAVLLAGLRCHRSIYIQGSCS